MNRARAEMKRGWELHDDNIIGAANMALTKLLNEIGYVGTARARLGGNMDDHQHADAIRQKVVELREAVKAAKDAGLEVSPPIMLQQFLLTGHAPGEPSTWTIKRRSL